MPFKNATQRAAVMAAIRGGAMAASGVLSIGLGVNTQSKLRKARKQKDKRLKRKPSKAKRAAETGLNVAATLGGPLTAAAANIVARRRARKERERGRTSYVKPKKKK
jgi:NaMN:DMB phosphoribosyltransferase